MNLKNTLFFFLFLILGTKSYAQDTCICPQVFAPVCGFLAVDNDTIYAEFPNSCYAACDGFTVIGDTTLCPNFGIEFDCGCPQPDTSYVCAQDTLGNIFSVPSECLAACWGLTVLPGVNCDSIPDWNCDCPEPDSLSYICAQDTLGNIYSVPSECLAACWGLTVLSGVNCDSIPDWNCDCPDIDTTGFVCAQDTFGNVYSVPSACIAACWGLTVVEGGDCDTEPWGNCDCEIDESELFKCAVDSLGHYCMVPNECIAQCWGLTIVNDTLCDPSVVDPEIDYELLNCIDSLNIDENTNFQQGLLMIHQSCGVELSECILNAPIFATDAEFLTYILTTCDSLGFNGNADSSNVLNTYNLLTNKTTKTKDDVSVGNTNIQLAVNPVSQTLTYLIESKKSTQAIITLYDINGKTMMSQQHSLDEGKQSFHTDISTIKSGLYFLNLYTEDGQKTVKVVVLQ
jgi:hypothetical protein